MISFRIGKARSGRGYENWKPGDIAECIYSGPWYGVSADQNPDYPGPKLGERFRVLRVHHASAPLFPGCYLFLVFPQFDARFHAGAFRKVVPQSDALKASEAEFAQLIRRVPRHASCPSRELEDA